MIKRHTLSTPLAMLSALFILLLTACGSDSLDTPKVEETLAPLQLTISVPQTNNGAKSRVGDPGEDDPENANAAWDRLTIIVAYVNKDKGDGIVDSNPEKMVYYDTFTKKQFDSKSPVKSESGSELSPADANGLHTYTMYLPLGTVRVYGVTYSQGTGLDIEATLDNIATDGKNHNTDVAALQISNDYAGLTSSSNESLNQFLSVATGYAVKVKTDGTLTNEQDISISKKSANLEDKYWRMPLTRLATKLDIQWDAKEAYVNNTYTDVTVNSIEHNGGASNLTEDNKSGYGRLFPTLQNSTAEALGGIKEFINSTPISKRNGRVYHYFFPDGSANSSVVFNLSLTPDGGKPQASTYTHKFATALESAVWYKLNATIKGSPKSDATNSQVVQNSFTSGN